MTKTRRRGPELEAAIFEATLAILDEEGFNNLSFQKVAERAGTSKPVIYRHFTDIFDLAISASQSRIRNTMGTFTEFEFTGNDLREDLLQAYNRFIKSFQVMGRSLIVAFFASESPNYENIINRINEMTQNSNLQVINKILQRALDRNEPIKKNVPDFLKVMPFEWIRYKAIFVQAEIDQAMIEDLIDHNVLPMFIEEKD